MNKPELRKLLSELQKARAKVDVWPDEIPRENSGARIPNGHSDADQAALLEASPFASSLNSFHKVCLKTAFLPAEEQMETVIEIASRRFSGKIPTAFVVQSLLWLQPQFTAMHYRLARAVQPMGAKLDSIAATVGAIRLHDKTCAEAAALHLSQVVIKAFQEDDKATLDRIKMLSNAELGNHRNFQIWTAIEETIKHSIKVAKDEGGSMNFPDPTTAEVRRYFAKHSHNESFSDLPGLKDHKGWTRLWKDSGAALTISKGCRGKKA